MHALIVDLLVPENNMGCAGTSTATCNMQNGGLHLTSQPRGSYNMLVHGTVILASSHLLIASKTPQALFIVFGKAASQEISRRTLHSHRRDTCFYRSVFSTPSLFQS